MNRPKRMRVGAMMEYKGYLGKVDIDGDQLYGTIVNLHRGPRGLPWLDR